MTKRKAEREMEEIVSALASRDRIGRHEVNDQDVAAELARRSMRRSPAEAKALLAVAAKVDLAQAGVTLRDTWREIAEERKLEEAARVAAEMLREGVPPYLYLDFKRRLAATIVAAIEANGGGSFVHGGFAYSANGGKLKTSLPV